LKLQRLQSKVHRTTDNFPRHTPARDCMWFFKLHMFMISLQNIAGSKQKSFKIITTQMFAVQDKANPNTKNIRCLNLVAVQAYDLSSD
jgi:hypothetical protein